MMAAVPGYKGYITSWASPNDTLLALWKPMGITVNATAEAYDSTAFASGGAAVRTKIKGLREWTAEVEAYPATPVAGHLGTLTATNIYDVHPRGWEITINADALETTEFQPSNNWKTFRAGLVSWSLNYECFLAEDTELVSMPDAAAGTTASFTATISSGTPNNTLAGTVVVTGCNIAERVGDLVLVRYTCEGTGHLTIAGSANLMPANSGSLSIPTASSLLVTLNDDADDETLTGDAFWTSLRVRTQVGQGVSFSASLRGTGALTPG